MSNPAPPPHAFETWLRTPWRRLTLVALGVVLLAGTSTLLVADSYAAVEREFDAWLAFQRRLITWGLWGLCFEPLLALSTLLGRARGPVVLVLLGHAAASVGVAFGVHEADKRLADALLPDQPAPFERGMRSMGRPGWRGPDWSERRGDRPDRPERDGERSERRGDRPERGEDPRTPEEREQERRERAASDPEYRERLERMQAFDAARQRFGRNRWAEAGVVAYWLIVGLGLALRSYTEHRDQERRAADLELQTARLEGELSTARLASLESQLQPHFLFNALHSVGGLVRGGRHEEALSTLSALGELLRASLRHGEGGDVPLAEELDLVEAYLDVERIRLGDRLDVELDAEPGVLDAPLPALLLLPLVENAIKHGIAPRPEGGRLCVRAASADGTLILSVQDDGPGFPEAVLAGGAVTSGDGGIGLTNTRSRVEALYGPDAIRLENLDGGGARVTLHLSTDG